MNQFFEQFLHNCEPTIEFKNINEKYFDEEHISKTKCTVLKSDMKTGKSYSNV